MSKQLDRVLGFCTQHRFASPMLTKLGQACLRTVKTAGIFAVWRRVPITTATITLVVGFWLYDYVSVSSAATASTSTARPSIAVVKEPPIAIQPLADGQPSNTGNDTRRRTRRPHHTKTAHSAFRRKRVGKNEVDYVANDVTIRLFTPGSKPTRAAHASRQLHIGKDETVHSFEPGTAQAQKTRPLSVMTQAAERSPLVSK